ncbi:hypothetical protein I546_4912 [Mycobacterium kansasii 732]|nr:hypothetical protein I546_4912 [Mycobacterium kansasii 732]
MLWNRDHRRVFGPVLTTVLHWWSPSRWCSWRNARHLPHGRSRAGDRHLNFYETRDNLGSYHTWMPPGIPAAPAYPAGLSHQRLRTRHFTDLAWAIVCHRDDDGATGCCGCAVVVGWDDACDRIGGNTGTADGVSATYTAAGGCTDHRCRRYRISSNPPFGRRVSDRRRHPGDDSR